LAATRARVGIDGITIVARFNISMKRTISTLRWSARTQTVVGIDIVAIVAALAGLNDSIAAARRLAVVAIIGWVIVPIITAFARSKHTIAATRRFAVVAAGIVII